VVDAEKPGVDSSDERRKHAYANSANPHPVSWTVFISIFLSLFCLLLCIFMFSASVHSGE